MLLAASFGLGAAETINTAKAQKKQAKIKAAEIEANRAERQRQREADQKKRIAQMRARLGASGAGGAGGSAAAIAAGLRKTSAERSLFEFGAAARDQQSLKVATNKSATSNLLNLASSAASTGRAIKQTGYFDEKSEDPAPTKEGTP